MKDLTITAIIKVYQYDELNEGDRSLIKTAMEATARSYSPYSHFSVGAAALLGNGTVVTGTNQENAAYPSGLCAERTTLFYANSQYPDQPVVTLAIAARTEKDFIDHPIPPCGACRQVILETEKRYKHPIRILFYANSQYPDQPVVTLAIAARTEKDFIDHPIPPCGACRQVILETEKRYKHPIRILLYGKECIYEVKSIGDLLPLSFDASAMED